MEGGPGEEKRELGVPVTSHCVESTGARSSPSPNSAARALTEEETVEKDGQQRR